MPWPLQALKADHWQLALHVRDCVPQLPHDWLPVVPTAHTP
jgi:hypothetical protein